MEMKVIAHIKSDFPTKFGIPHQSGRIKELKAEIVFEPEYQVAEAFRGIEEYTHLWLIWEASSHCGSDDRLYLHSLLGRDRCGLLYHSSRKPDKALCEKRAERRKADSSWNPCVQNLQA